MQITILLLLLENENKELLIKHFFHIVVDVEESTDNSYKDLINDYEKVCNNFTKL